MLDLIFQPPNEIFSNKYIDTLSNTYFLYKILFNLQLVLENSNNNFNKILLNYFDNNLSKDSTKIVFLQQFIILFIIRIIIINILKKNILKFVNFKK